MATDNTVAEIACRFGSERLEIVQYVNFMRDQCAIHEQEIVELNTILSRHGLPELPTRDYLATDHHLTPAEIGDLVRASDRVTPAIDRLRGDLNQITDDIAVVGADAVFEYPDLLGEWTDYAMEHLPPDPRAEGYRVAEEVLFADVASQRELDDELSLSDRRLIVNEALRKARHIKFRNISNALQYLLDRFKTIKTIGKLVEPNAVVGALRQGFILLMTAFDAAIFDLVRVKLRKDFFGLIGSFGKNEKVTLQQFGGVGCFETFRDQIIDEQLKVRYLKDLLFLLQGLNVACIDETEGHQFVQLIELVIRRNVHVHNRGMVDDRYLEPDPQSKKPKYNLYNLSLGDVARIDERYWELANLLCCHCIHGVAAWGDS